MRGDFATIALQGDFGKLRSALVMQSDQFNGHSTVTVTVLPVTSTHLSTRPYYALGSSPVLEVVCKSRLRSWWTRP